MEQPELQATLIPLAKAIKWVGSDGIRTDHATHMLVQQQGTEFTFLFFEAVAPLIMGTPEEQIAAYKALEYIEAKCVAKVVMSAENVALGANNLIDSLNKYGLMQQQSMRGQENAATETPNNSKQSLDSRA